MTRATTIVIDAGHGGTEPAGKSSAYGVRGPGGTLEKHVTLAVAREVARQLDADVVLTRTGDRNVSLADRCAVGQRVGAAVFVSLHADADPGGGARTFVHTRASSGSQELARGISRALGGPGGPVSGELAVLTPDRHAPGTAACLVDVASLLDAAGEARLRDPREVARIGGAIAEGIRRYRGAASYGRGTVAKISNDAPREGRDRQPASNVDSAGPFTLTQFYVANNEVTFEFAAIGVEDTDPVPFEGPVDAEVRVALRSNSDGADLGQHTVQILNDHRGYITFTGSSQDPIDPRCDFTVTVTDNITPARRLILRMWTWT
jgi:hypothetical protein